MHGFVPLTMKRNSCVLLVTSISRCLHEYSTRCCSNVDVTFSVESSIFCTPKLRHVLWKPIYNSPFTLSLAISSQFEFFTCGSWAYKSPSQKFNFIVAYSVLRPGGRDVYINSTANLRDSHAVATAPSADSYSSRCDLMASRIDPQLSHLPFAARVRQLFVIWISPSEMLRGGGQCRN